MASEGPSISELISTALAQAGRLIRDEVQLARAEVSSSFSDALRPITLIVAGVSVMTAAVVLLLAAFAAWLVQEGWSDPSAKLVAALFGAAGSSALVWLGISRLRADALLPRKTADQVQKDIAAVKEHL